MNKKIFFTVLVSAILSGAGFIYLRSILNNNEKFEKRIKDLFYDGGDEDNDSNN